MKENGIESKERDFFFNERENETTENQNKEKDENIVKKKKETKIKTDLNGIKIEKKVHKNYLKKKKTHQFFCSLQIFPCYQFTVV